MYRAILFLIVLMPFWAIVDRWIRKKFNIEKEWGFNFVNKIDKFGTIAIYVIVPISFLTILYLTDIRVPGNPAPFVPQFYFRVIFFDCNIPHCYAMEIQQRSETLYPRSFG